MDPQQNELNQVKTHEVGIIMNDVTGCIRSVMTILAQDEVKINEQETIMPIPILVGHNKDKLEKLAAQAVIQEWTTDLDEALMDAWNIIYFDAQLTKYRPS